jgi:hypothetical protein
LLVMTLHSKNFVYSNSFLRSGVLVPFIA